MTNPQQTAIISSRYQETILPALHYRFKTFWFNPNHLICPGLIPLHDDELHSLVELPELLQHPVLPDWMTCQVWIAQEGIAPLLWMHVEGVAAISYYLATKLQAKGFSVNPLLAHRGGLLHDLCKLSGNRDHHGQRRIDHGELAYQRLMTKGLPELAEIARRHPLHCLLTPETMPNTWEQKIVHYADKLIEGSRVVDLSERIHSLQNRYPDHDDQIQQAVPALIKLQDEFCDALSLTPEELFKQTTAQMGYLHKK